MRGWLERVGRALVALGAVVLLFAGYQVWGTDWVNARDQRALKSEIRERLAESPPPTSSGDEELPDDDETPGDDAAPGLITTPEPGEPLGLIEIPAIDVERAIVEGVGRDELQKGPGHYPHSPLPGRNGNVSIAGHRTTYGAPFGDLDDLEPGDEIVVTTEDGRFTYVVADQLIVDPGDVSVIEATDDARLTLTTCNPKYSARERLIIQAELEGDPIGVPPAGTQDPSTPDDDRSDGGDGGSPPGGLPGEDVLSAGLDGASDSGLSAIDRGTLLWTLAMVAVVSLWMLVVIERPRWYTRFGGVVPFLIVLFFFFGEVESLLPANF